MRRFPKKRERMTITSHFCLQSWQFLIWCAKKVRNPLLRFLKNIKTWSDHFQYFLDFIWFKFWFGNRTPRLQLNPVYIGIPFTNRWKKCSTEKLEIIQTKIIKIQIRFCQLWEQKCEVIVKKSLFFGTLLI